MQRQRFEGLQPGKSQPIPTHKGPTAWFSRLVVTLAVAILWPLYLLFNDWIDLEVQLGLVRQPAYITLRMVVLLAFLFLDLLILGSHGLNIIILVINNWKIKRILRKREQEKKDNLDSSQQSQRKTIPLQSELMKRPTIVPPMDTPFPKSYGQLLYDSQIGQTSAQRGVQLEFPSSSKSAQAKESLGMFSSPVLQPFQQNDQNQFHGPLLNGVQKEILGQPLDYFQQQKSIDKYYPSVKFVRAVSGGGVGMETSPPQVVDQVLLSLKLDDRVLEVWTDRLRQWLASHVLKPLVRQIGVAHLEVIEKTAKLGLNVNLPPLDKGAPGTALRGQLQMSDESQPALLLYQQLQHTLNQLKHPPSGLLATPQNQQQKDEKIRLLEESLLVVRKYQSLSALLRGQFVKCNMLLGSSRYLVSRIKQFACDSCVGCFIWNGGGSFDGQSWNSSLPTDTAVVFYLLASFLKAPNWIWPEDQNAYISSSSGPLYLGEIPVRAPERYTAMVTVKPGQLNIKATVMAAMLQPQFPQFSLILEGQEVCTVGSHTGLFHCFLMFLQYVKQQLGGTLGGHSLEMLGLAKVIAPVEPNFGVSQRVWFGLW